MVRARAGITMGLFWLATGIAAADNQVIGTMAVTIDGERQNWYLLQPEGDLAPTASWLAMGAERGVASLAAFPSADVALIRHPRSDATVPAGDAPMLLVSFAFSVGVDDVLHTLPPEAGSGPASLVYAPDWRDPESTFTTSDGSGTIRVIYVRPSRNGGSQFTGTFDGILRNPDGETMVFSDGRFEVQDAGFSSSSGARAAGTSRAAGG